MAGSGRGGSGDEPCGRVAPNTKVPLLFGLALTAAHLLDAVATLGEIPLVKTAYVGSALLFLQALFCWWLARCCAADMTGYLLPGSLQRRSHDGYHWHVW